MWVIQRYLERDLGVNPPRYRVEVHGVTTLLGTHCFVFARQSVVDYILDYEGAFGTRHAAYQRSMYGHAFAICVNT